MAQFDVYENKNPRTKKHVPCFLDLQNDLHDILATRLVVPPVKDLEPITHLNPVLTVKRETLIMATREMTAVPGELCTTKVTSLTDNRNEIVGLSIFWLQAFK